MFKKRCKKLLYSFLILVLIVTSMPLNTISAINNKSIEIDGEELTSLIESNNVEEETYQTQKLEKINELSKELAEEASHFSTFSTLNAGGELANDFLSIALATNGRFTMGTTGGNPNVDTDDNKILLFGHPHPSTSYTTIRKNGEDYYFSATESYVDESRNEMVSIQVIDNLEVKQILTFTNNTTTNREDIVNIRYELSNIGEEDITAGTRVMLDTMLGRNDGAPFRVPGIGEVLYERELVGSQVPQYWQAFDNLENPNVVANGTFYQTLYDRPDKVQFAYWWDIYGTMWDYEVTSDKSVTRDSAVAIYHNPELITPGETRVIDTYYGIGDFAISDTEGALSIRITAPNELIEDTENASYLSNPFTITGYVRNNGTEVLRDTTVSLELPEQSGLTVLTPQDPSISLGNLEVGEEKIVNWTILAASQSSDQEIDYAIKVNASNEEEKTVPLSIFLPEVASESAGTISVNKDQIDLNVGESETLRATLNGIRGDVTWLSDNPNVATVHSNGTVTAKAGGTAKIIATAGGQVAVTTVTVNGDAIVLDDISFNSDNVELNINQSKRLTINFTPENATNKRISTWISSDPSIVRVSNGIIRGVSAGTTTITAISEEGGHRASITVHVSEAEPTLHFGEGISFSENITGPEVSFGGHDFPLFSLPFEMEVSIADQIKLTYDSSEDKFIGYFGDLSVTGTDDRNDDGTLTEDAKKLRKDTYQTVKSLMNKVGKSTNRDFYNSYRSLIKKGSGFVVQGDQTIFGFVELVNTKDGYQLAEGQIVVLHTAGFNMRYRFPPAPVAYLRFGVTGSLQSGLRLQLKEAGSLTSGVDVYGSFEGKLTPGLGVGAGHDAVLRVEAGLEGELAAKLDIPFTKKFEASEHLGLELTAKVYLEYQALLFFNGKNTWEIAKKQLYPGPEARSFAFNTLNINDEIESFELMPRAYVTSPSHFIANQAPRTFTMQSLQASEVVGNKVIKDNVYPHGSPVITTLDNGNQLLVWVDDDRDRTSANRTALYYSIYDGTYWSEPVQVDNDNTADFEPSVIVHNDEVYLAWQNLDRTFNEDVTLDEMVQALTISVAKFDGEHFVDIAQLTEEQSNPTSVPKLASNGSELAVIWIENEENDVMHTSNTNRIMEAVYSDDSGWSAPSIVADELSSISSFDIAYNNDERVIAFSIDEQIYLIKDDDTPIQITNQEVVNQSPVFSSSPNGTNLYWLSDGEIKQMTNLEESSITTAVTNVDNIENFDVVINKEKRLLYWEEANGFKTEVHGAFYDHSRSQWGNPIRLIDEESRLRGVNGLMNENGNVTFVYNSVAVNEDDFDTELAPFGRVDLMTTTIVPSFDLAILSNINFDTNSVYPEEELLLSFDLANIGQKAVEGYKVDVYQDDEIVFSQTMDETLLSGEEQYVEVIYSLPEELNEHVITVKVTPLNGIDSNLTDNEAEVSIGQSNIEVSKPVISGEGATRKLRAEVKNIGYKTAKDIELRLVSERLDGDVVASKVIDTISPESSTFVEFEIDMSSMNFTADSDDALFYVVAEGSEEFQNGLHYNFTKLMNPYAGNLLQISEVGIAGNNLIFTINNNVPEEVEGTILVQTINNGVQETIGQAANFQSLYGHSMQFDISSILNDMDESSTIRLFVVDGNDVTISNTIDLGEKVEAPVANPEPGTYKESQSVVLYTMTQEAEIYYTTDGTDPTTESERYTLPIEVMETTTIKAIAVKPGQTDSEVVELTFVIDPDEGEPGDEGDPGDGNGPSNGEPGESDDGNEPSDSGEPSDGSSDNSDGESSDGNDSEEIDNIRDESTEDVKSEVSDDDKSKSTRDEEAENNKESKLPKTATFIYNILFMGVLLLGIGWIFLQRARRKVI